MAAQLGYCTNVHAGASWMETWDNLRRHAVDVRRRRGDDRPMGVGLWLSADSARQLVEARQIPAFSQWLAESQLVPYTFNGFPYGDFHQPRVKHLVYRPTWRQQPRRDYTIQLAEIMHQLLPPGAEGSISTLPLQWGQPAPTPEEFSAAARNLRDVASHLARMESETGRLIYVCLEPEPGCVLQRSSDVVRFFEDYLLAPGDEQMIRRHLRVCHDVCHGVVMLESQADILRRYQQAGLGVGKMQLSSAICVDFGQLPIEQRREAFDQLRTFAEDRYLHQTMIQMPDGSATFHDDLPSALDTVIDPSRHEGRWRIHFHVPVYLTSFGHLRASQDAILESLRTARDTHPQLQHFEVETYAWGVLPEELQVTELAEGIAREMCWVDRVWASAASDGTAGGDAGMSSSETVQERDET